MLARSHDEIKYGAISVVLDIKNITAVTMAAIDESQDMQKSVRSAQLIPFDWSQASKFPDEQWDPMFTVRIAQKNHHPQRFQTKGPDNVPPDGIRFPKSCAFNTPLYEQVVNEAPKLRYEQGNLFDCGDLDRTYEIRSEHLMGQFGIVICSEEELAEYTQRFRF